MTREERLEAEAWYQALRAWKTRTLTDTIPRGPRRTPGGPPARVVWGCPVCRSTRVAEWDERILEARARGEDLTPVVRGIACAIRVREAVVWSHARDHLDLEATRPVIGGWAYDRRVRLGEHLLTPAGWIPVERVLAAIREAPEEYRGLLDQVRFGKGPRRLLDKNGKFRGDARAAYGRAALWLAQRLLRSSLSFPLGPMR